MRKQDVLQGLRSVYAKFTLAKLIWGRGPLAPDSFSLKRCLRIIYACLRHVYAKFTHSLRMNTHERSWRSFRMFTLVYACLRNDYAMFTHSLRMITHVRKHT